MSRSGYSEDFDDNPGTLNLYRANVDRTIAGKRGQAFLREMAAALDAMPVKELIADDLVKNGHACAIGSVALARKLDVSDLDPYDRDAVGKTFGITPMLCAEIAYENDSHGWVYENGKGRLETPAERWKRMREWVDSCLKKENSGG